MICCLSSAGRSASLNAQSYFEGCLVVLKGCLMVSKGCLIVFKECLPVFKGCLIVFMGRLMVFGVPDSVQKQIPVPWFSCVAALNNTVHFRWGRWRVDMTSSLQYSRTGLILLAYYNDIQRMSIEALCNI